MPRLLDLELKCLKNPMLAKLISDLAHGLPVGNLWFKMLRMLGEAMWGLETLLGKSRTEARAPSEIFLNHPPNGPPEKCLRFPPSSENGKGRETWVFTGSLPGNHHLIRATGLSISEGDSSESRVFSSVGDPG